MTALEGIPIDGVAVVSPKFRGQRCIKLNGAGVDKSLISIAFTSRQGAIEFRGQ